MSSIDRKAQQYAYLIKRGEREARNQRIRDMQALPFKIREGDGAEESSRDLSVALNAWLTKHGTRIVKNCGNCRHMGKEGPASCGRYNMTPPIEIIMRGCDDHEDESDVPF